MKCPKCNYISFDGADRCRNCGYDFALAPEEGSLVELPLRDAASPALPGSDYPLAPPEEGAGVAPRASRPAPIPERGRRAGQVAGPAEASADLPLFDEPIAGVDDTPLLRAPAAPRPPLSVRRSTASDTPRPHADTAASVRAGRSSTSAPAPALRVAGMGDGTAPRDDGPAAVAAPASRRLLAAAVDLALLGTIDLAVIYFTLRLTGLDFARLGSLPLAPLLGFFAILNGGYLVGFTAASGQTIGKMIAGIRVVADTSTRVPLATAVVRAAAMLATLGTLGIAYIPGLTGADRRALHDRLSGTRVVAR